MDPQLTNEDVADILALLDSLPYDELDLETPRFRLTLRRTPGGWTQSTHVTGPAEGAAHGVRGPLPPSIGGDAPLTPLDEAGSGGRGPLTPVDGDRSGAGDGDGDEGGE